MGCACQPAAIGAAIILACLTSNAQAEAPAGSCESKEPQDEIAMVRKLSDELTKAQTSMKSDAQVNHWMSCFSKNQALQAKFQAEYGAYVERAAQAYGLPYALLACLFFTESKWDRKAVSAVGAIGLAQLMVSPTLPEINRLIGWQDQSDRLEAQKTAYAVEMKRKHLGPKHAEYRAGFEIIKGEKDLNAVKVQAQQGWKDYWAEKKTPKKLAKADLENAERAIGAGAMYLKFILLQYGFSAKGPLSQLLLATGAYNIGPSAMHVTFARAKRSYAGVLAALKKLGNTETPEHMENIRLCLEKDNWKPGDEKDPRKCKPS